MHRNDSSELFRITFAVSIKLYAFHKKPKKFLAFCAPCPFAQTKRAEFVKFDERRMWKTGGKHDMIDPQQDNDAAPDRPGARLLKEV